VPWQSIAAFRNVLVHDYLRIDQNIVWDVVERDVPELKQAVLDMLASLQDAPLRDDIE
jgi:uncharacterized protein with HEPN domain